MTTAKVWVRYRVVIVAGGQIAVFYVGGYGDPAAARVVLGGREFRVINICLAAGKRNQHRHLKPVFLKPSDAVMLLAAIRADGLVVEEAVEPHLRFNRPPYH